MQAVKLDFVDGLFITTDTFDRIARAEAKHVKTDAKGRKYLESSRVFADSPKQMWICRLPDGHKPVSYDSDAWRDDVVRTEDFIFFPVQEDGPLIFVTGEEVRWTYINYRRTGWPLIGYIYCDS